MDDTWTCRECGWVNEGGRYCFECGRDGDPDRITHQRLGAEPGEGDPRWRKAALIVGAIALLAACAGGAYVLLSGDDGKPAKTTADKVAPPPVPPVKSTKLTRGQTEDELIKIVAASRTGLAATRKGEWAQAAANRKRLVARTRALADKTDELDAARTALASALKASETANRKSLACKDKGSVSACAAPAHQRATKLKEKFRAAFNKILDEDGRDLVKANSF